MNIPRKTPSAVQLIAKTRLFRLAPPFQPSGSTQNSSEGLVELVREYETIDSKEDTNH
ncbi:MAG TPA: hypothetical protein VEL52_05070 [Candidatus Bathyarchaeia archaeon]|nr:hypothetical protein [Candidatus Bathyarchaeia archaeon]